MNVSHQYKRECITSSLITNISDYLRAQNLQMNTEKKYLYKDDYEHNLGVHRILPEKDSR